MSALMFSLEVFALSMSTKTKNSRFVAVSVDGRISMGQFNIPTFDLNTWDKVLKQEDAKPSEKDEENFSSMENPLALRKPLPKVSVE